MLSRGFVTNCKVVANPIIQRGCGGVVLVMIGFAEVGCGRVACGVVLRWGWWLGDRSGEGLGCGEGVV